MLRVHGIFKDTCERQQINKATIFQIAHLFMVSNAHTYACVFISSSIRPVKKV